MMTSVCMTSWRAAVGLGIGYLRIIEYGACNFLCQVGGFALGCGSRRVEDVQAVSGGGGLAARGGAELAEDVGHVHAGGLGRDEQLGRDLAVPAPGRDQPQDLQF